MPDEYPPLSDEPLGDPAFGDPAFGEPLAAGVTPLSVFFPNITDEEARFLDGETMLIAERRARCMTLYRAGMGMEAIRRELKCSIGTVHNDLHTVLENYKRLALKDAAWHTADMLSRLAHREHEVEIDLERSRGEQVETSTSKRSSGSGDFGQAAVKKRTKFGDARLHSLLQGYWDRRAKLMGLLRTEDFKKESEPQVKLVAGIDPAELV